MRSGSIGSTQNTFWINDFRFRDQWLPEKVVEEYWPSHLLAMVSYLAE